MRSKDIMSDNPDRDKKEDTYKIDYNKPIETQRTQIKEWLKQIETQRDKKGMLELSVLFRKMDLDYIYNITFCKGYLERDMISIAKDMRFDVAVVKWLFYIYFILPVNERDSL